MKAAAPDFRTLSVAERLQLVQDIWDSIAADAPEAVRLTPAQQKEVRHRLAAHDANPKSALAWDEVRTELFQRRH